MSAEYPKINNSVDYIHRVISAYKEAESLCATPERGAVYEHVNGIGCGVSCVIPPITSAYIQRLCGVAKISEVLRHEKAGEFVRQYIGDPVPESLLVRVQRVHDQSVLYGGVKGFISELQVILFDLYPPLIPRR